MSGERISVREFARRLDIDEKAVRKAIAAGRIVEGYDKETKKILPEKATAEWGYRHELVKKRPGVSKEKTVEKMASAQARPAAASEPVSSPAVGFPIDSAAALGLVEDIVISSLMPMHEAARLREVIGAAQDKLKLAEAEGRLVAKDKVEKVLYALGSELKKALLNIPVRVVRDIQAAPGEVEGINILTDEITAVLTTYGNLAPNAL